MPLWIVLNQMEDESYYSALYNIRMQCNPIMQLYMHAHIKIEQQ